MTKKKRKHKPQKEDKQQTLTTEQAFEKVWDVTCEVCDSVPVVRATGLCGPCTWGEADTAGGNW